MDRDARISVCHRLSGTPRLQLPDRPPYGPLEFGTRNRSALFIPSSALRPKISGRRRHLLCLTQPRWSSNSQPFCTSSRRSACSSASCSGTIIGRFHFKGVGFGAVVGTLIAGIVVGIFAKPELPELLRWAFFYLFLFSIGYSVGPQFFGSLKKEALPQIALALVVAVSGLATVIAVAAAFGFDEGIAVGLLSGGMTQSAALGTGLSAIAELPIPDATEGAR